MGNTEIFLQKEGDSFLEALWNTLSPLTGLVRFSVIDGLHPSLTYRRPYRAIHNM